MNYQSEREALAAAFRWAERLNLHEAVANHFSLAVNDTGIQFLLNPNQIHFSSIKASNLLLLDANNRKEAMASPGGLDMSAWGLHGSIHRNCPHARCIIHAHPTYSTVLASLADSKMPAIDQNTATFFKRIVIDESYNGLAFESEGERCSKLLSDPKKKVMIMGNHGVLILGSSVADTFNRLYYFERAAETYIKALQTRQKLRILSENIAEKTATQIEAFPGQGERHFSELRRILDEEGSDYCT